MLLNRLWDHSFWLGMGVLVILLSKECSLAKDTPQRVTATTRNREAMRALGAYCSPDCLVCNSLTRGAAQLPTCELCKLGYKIDSNGLCKRIECDAVPHCVVCSGEVCIRCLPGYILSAGTCLDQLDWIRGRSREGSLGNSSYYGDHYHGAQMLNAWKIVIAGLILLPCVFLYIIRGLRRRLLVEALSNRAPAVVLAFPTNDHRSDGRSTEDDRVEESEAASLLSSSDVQTAKRSNAVLVVDPMGNIEMGVRQERDDQNEDLEL